MALDGARHSCRFFLSRLAVQSSQLAALKYPGNHPGPLLWIELIQGIVETAQSYIQQSEDKTKTSDQQLALIREAGRIATTAYHWLRMMSGTGIDELPYSVVLPMERWYRRVGLKHQTLFRAELVANYEIRSVDKALFLRIRDRSKKLDDALTKIEWPIQRITVPTRALGMLPHFAIVAHEIGHAIFPNVTWDLKKFSADEAALNARIQAHLGGKPLTPAILVYKTGVAIDWLQEIAADAFGHLMAGPAFFFALCGFLQTAGAGVGLSETHPANEFRRDLLYRELERGGANSFSKVFEKHLGIPLAKNLNSELFVAVPAKAQLITDLTAQLSSGPGITSYEKAVVLAELTPYMDAISQRVYELAEAHLNSIDPNLIYTSATFENDIGEHLASLIQAIPPIESGVDLNSRAPTDFATILNIGWIVLLAKLDQLLVRSESTTDVNVDKAEKLHALLLKAVELSEAKRTWEAAS